MRGARDGDVGQAYVVFNMRRWQELFQLSRVSIVILSLSMPPVYPARQIVLCPQLSVRRAVFLL